MFSCVGSLRVLWLPLPQRSPRYSAVFLYRSPEQTNWTLSYWIIKFIINIFSCLFLLLMIKRINTSSQFFFTFFVFKHSLWRVLWHQMFCRRLHVSLCFILKTINSPPLWFMVLIFPIKAEMILIKSTDHFDWSWPVSTRGCAASWITARPHEARGCRTKRHRVQRTTGRVLCRVH